MLVARKLICLTGKCFRVQGAIDPVRSISFGTDVTDWMVVQSVHSPHLGCLSKHSNYHENSPILLACHCGRQMGYWYPSISPPLCILCLALVDLAVQPLDRWMSIKIHLRHTHKMTEHFVANSVSFKNKEQLNINSRCIVGRKESSRLVIRLLFSQITILWENLL